MVNTWLFFFHNSLLLHRVGSLPLHLTGLLVDGLVLPHLPEPDAALLVTQHPVRLHTYSQALVKPAT